MGWESGLEAQMKLKKVHLDILLSVYVSFVFVQSLFYKFTNSVETQHIFGTLDRWAGGFGLEGVFAPSGIFSQYVIGSAELVASALLLGGLAAGLKWLHGLGALLSLGVISGAIVFHLFTPLGVVVLGDGGLLFAMACGVWISSALILWLNRAELIACIGGLLGRKAA